MHPTTVEMIGAGLFAIAVLHTFSTKFFEHLAHTRPAHAGLWHLLGEVEAVFGFWALVLVMFMFSIDGKAAATTYLDTQNYTEPLFVFAIMVIAGSKPIIQVARVGVSAIARLLPMPAGMAYFITTLSVVPLMGSLITEPAAMTLAAMLLRDRYYSNPISQRLKYAAIGTLFVNVSIGGTLTPFAAPPVLMVAAKWNWDLMYMLTHFGWKSAIAVLVNASVLTALFAAELRRLPAAPADHPADQVPVAVMMIHMLFLGGVVLFSHHPAVFMGLFLFFLGFTQAYRRYQDPLILREGLMVAFFLAGLVVLGGQQKWWLQPMLANMDATMIYFGATALTAITDNAALTYLGSLVDGLSESFKYALVAGAVTGGGLTVIANAPNPAGFSILRGSFDEGAINPLYLFLAALPPTITAILAFQLL
ncbi:putative Na+/H+ antiporter [Novispirillum itersonii]|uniref:putative Na+/H+ antiporter n=1 Tax=Novispirillum itersonii TaxID=189 RepID=UPI0003AA679E|nr:putative Na+/H+ antiporter [Novispirillum itersonii]